MSDDKKTIDFKKAKTNRLNNNKGGKNSNINNSILRSLGKIPPLPPTKKKQEFNIPSNLDEILKQRGQDMREMERMKRTIESEEYTARVLQIAHDVYVKSQPHLLKTEEERLALAESSVQAGQAFYRIAKEFIQYVATEDLINDIVSSKEEFNF